MKSDIEIKDDIYEFIKGSALEKAISGKLKKTRRPANSNLEDIVISILDNEAGQMQEAFVNVNIYVPDNMRDGQAEEKSIRLRELCRIAYNLLEVGRGESYRFTLDKQRVFEVNGKSEHFINLSLIHI